MHSSCAVLILLSWALQSSLLAPIAFGAASPQINAAKTSSLGVRRLVEAATVNLGGNVWIPDGSKDVEVVINGGEYSSTPLYPGGDFTLAGVKPGVYLLEVHHPYLVYPQVRVEISAARGSDSANDLQIVASYLTDGELVGSFSRIKGPIMLSPEGAHEFFPASNRLAFLSMLRNPLVLLALVSFGLMAILPKLQSGVDPEELREMTGASDVPIYKSRFIDSIEAGRPCVLGSPIPNCGGTTSAAASTTLQSSALTSASGLKGRKKGH